jgi:mRNA interferase MazF
VPAPGDIVLVRFPFSNLRESKRRPALVIADAGDGDVLFARITSQESYEPYDLPIAEWEQSGLKAPSWLRLSKLAVLDGKQLFRTLGRLEPRTEAAARTLLLRWIAEAWQLERDDGGARAAATDPS